MEGRRSCVNWYHYQDFREAFPGHEVVADRFFVADGPRITCAGGAGSAALATHLIEQHLGRAQAQKATQVLFSIARARGATRTASTSVGGDQRAARAPGVAADGAEPDTADLDRRDRRELGVSTRQLERLCRENVSMGPASLYRQLRMRYASWLIQNTDRSMTDIAIETGFADSRTSPASSRTLTASPPRLTVYNPIAPPTRTRRARECSTEFSPA